MSNTDAFFNNLQKHSEIKLMILEKYVEAWLRKITLGPYANPALIIDGFAGTGKYSDDEDGSPIRLLKHSINFCEQAKKNNWKMPEIYLLFIEYDTNNYKELLMNLEKVGVNTTTDSAGFISIPKYPSVRILCRNGAFADVLEEVLSMINENDTLIPSFCFMDPFGFSNTPFSLIKKYLENDKSEFLLNFIFEETNRFINVENVKVQEHIKRHFGLEKIDDLTNLIYDKKGAVRKELVVHIYTKQLYEHTSVKHILSFEIKKNGRTKLILFYGTKSIHGLKTMKKTMWDIDGTGTYMFDDRNPLEQISFFDIDIFGRDEDYKNLAKLIYANFKGSKVNISHIKEFVLVKTIYPLEHYMRGALKILEKEEKISSVQGRNNKYTYPEKSIITFV